MAEETKISAEEFRRLAVLEEERQKKNQEVEEEISESLDTIRRSWLNESSLSDHTTLEKTFLNP